MECLGTNVVCSSLPLLLTMGNARSDAQSYRDGYPDREDPPLSEAHANLDFYQNKISSTPDGNFIDVILQTWKGQYNILEEHHTYIQWLFPIREQGVNQMAQPLTLYEAEAIKKDQEAMQRVVLAYRMMLEFYGMQLDDESTGAVARATKGGSPKVAGNDYGYGMSEEDQRERYSNLNMSFHNNLRITRILKCLGELGLEHYKLPFIQHCLVEIYEGNRPLRNCEESCCDYWVAVLRSDEERASVQQYIDEHRTDPEDLKMRRNIQMVGALGLMGGISEEYAAEMEDNNRAKREAAAVEVENGGTRKAEEEQEKGES